MKTQTLPNARNNLEDKILFGAFAALFASCGNALAGTRGVGPLSIHKKI